MQKYAELLRLLEQTEQPVLLLTPTKRLARHLSQAYNQHKLAQQQSAWPSAAVLSLGSWLQQQWQEYALYCESPALLLSDWQSQQLWLQMAQQMPYADNLFSITELANMARQAWQTLQSWCLSLSDLPEEPQQEVLAFKALAQQYEQHAQQHNYIDAVQIPALLAEHWSLLPTPTQQIVLTGFDERVPSIEKLLAAAAQSGQAWQFCDSTITATQPYICTCSDRQAEWQAAAAWAKKKLQQHSQQQLAIVVPELSRYRQEIEYEFRQQLAAELPLTADSDQLPFTLSAGEPLAQQGVVGVALILLTALMTDLDLESCSILLRSRYLCGAAKEQQARLALDMAMREQGMERITFPLLLQLQQTLVNEHTHFDTWQAIVDSLLHFRTTYAAESQQAARWMQLFSELLLQVGWPGEQAVNSKEYQAVQQWLQLASEFAQLEQTQTTLSLKQAVTLLRTEAQQRLFQIQAADKSMQILGQLEAAALQFDGLWISGMTADAWPPAAQPNPLLPIAWQQQQLMPHASSERELLFAKKLTQRFVNSAREVVFSYAQQEDDKDNALSPLLTQYQQNPLPAAVAMTADRTSVLSHKIDDYGVAYPSKRLQQGAAIFNLMAACPFKAYAKLRWRAETLVLPWQGLEARERGQLRHRLLQLFWQKCQNSKQLQHYTESERQQLGQELVQQVLQEWQQQQQRLYSDRYLAIEAEQLQQLLQQWLQVEESREEFSVLACEQKVSMTLQGYELQLRIDRLDQLASGGYALIDYKIGQRSLTDWLGDRPYDCQLPLYSLVLGDKVQVLAFAELTPAQPRFRGIGQQDDLLPQVKSLAKNKKTFADLDWQALHQQWRQVTDQLILDYSRGKACVAPKNGAVTCRLCDLQGLCRVGGKQ